MMPQGLEQLFESGTLVRPTDSAVNLVHIVRAIGQLCGINDGATSSSPATQEAIDLIGPSPHLIFILIDGLGMNILEKLPPNSFLTTHVIRPIRAVCPSTTAAALTTVTTGVYPSQHGVTGWFTYLPDHSLTAVMLPFAERGTNVPLVSKGIRPGDLLPPPILPLMTHRPLTLVPSYITNTPYNVYSRGGTDGQGYEDLEDAIDKTVAAIITAKVPTYVHVYLHDVDTMCHHVGVNHEGVVPMVMGIDAELARLADAVKGKARIVITADHGLINVPKDQQTLLMAGDDLLDLLLVPPTGDARMPVFHVREEKRHAFVDLFHRRYDDRMALLETPQAESMQLFGPGKMSPIARKRFGDFIAFPCRPATLAFHPPGKPVGELYLAVHGGLSEDEMEVPLCLV